MKNLIMHRGGRIATEAEVRAVPKVDFTDTWHPWHHAQVIDCLNQAAEKQKLCIARREYGLSQDGLDLFAVWHLDQGAALENKNLIRYEQDSHYVKSNGTLSIGIRNSMAKRLAVGVCAGFSTFVCDNLAFSSEIVLFRKHTSGLDISELRMIAGGAMEKLFETYPNFIAWLRDLDCYAAEPTQMHAIISAAVFAGVFPGSKMLELKAMLFEKDGRYFPKERSDGRITLAALHGAMTEIIGGARALIGYQRSNNKLNSFLDGAHAFLSNDQIGWLYEKEPNSMTEEELFMKGRQGKCIRCKTRFLFLYPVRLKDAYCGTCGEKLRATTYLLKWPVKFGAASYSEARFIRERRREALLRKKS